ncbi:nascent polypeptide-associated complex subunit alpha, muscle-specific form-like [Dromiciops gliroides]|uniref:nascent polypeptide-associated complex subunit alpha, muscle-specific form-like n=1 Tax=Dromiciops gliroides TaxID=33562 RepID=UPI001CC3E9BD|nr:nascent polypeptide-associated complex subunit alpha, muscle-specific form-like [Dromiciops gliroides]
MEAPFSGQEAISKSVQYPSVSGTTATTDVSQPQLSSTSLHSISESMEAPFLRSVSESMEAPLSDQGPTSKSVQYPSVSGTTATTEVSQPQPSSTSLHSEKFAEKESIQSPTPSLQTESSQASLPSRKISLSKTMKYPSFSGTSIYPVESSQGEPIQGADIYELKLTGESMDIFIISGTSSTRESLQVPLPSISPSTKEPEEEALQLSSSRSAEEYAETEMVQSPTPRESFEVPFLSTSPSSQGAPEGLESSDLLSPEQFAEHDVQSPTPSSQTESKQGISPSRKISLNEAIQYPSFSGTRVYSVESLWKDSIQGSDISVSKTSSVLSATNSWRESINGLDFCESSLLQESLEYSVISGPSSTRESLEIPLLSPSTSSKEATEGLQSLGFNSLVQITENDSVQYEKESIHGPAFSELTSLRESRKSLEFSIFSRPSSIQELLEVPLISTSISSKESQEGLPSLGLRTTEELGENERFTENENIRSNSPHPVRESKPGSPPPSLMSLNKGIQIPSFSGQRALSVPTSRRESIQGLDFSETNSLQESFGLPIISRPRSPLQSLDIPLLFTLPSSKGTIEGLQSSGLQSPAEFIRDGKNENIRSNSPHPVRESKPGSPPPSLMSLNKGIQIPSFSGQRALSVPTSRRESIQGLDFSETNSLQESFGLPIISRPRSPLQSLDIPLLFTLPSSKGTIEGLQSSGLQSPAEFIRDGSSRSASPSSPWESARPSPATSPRLLSKTFAYSCFSGESISQHSMEVPDFSVPTSHKESTQASALSGPNSLRGSFEFPAISESRSTRESLVVPSLYISSSSRVSTHVPTSSGLKSPTENGERERAHSPSPSSPRGSAQPSPIASPRLLKKPMPSLYSGADPLKQSVDGPSYSVSSSRRESVQSHAFASTNSLKESFEFPVISRPSSTRESLEVPPFSISSPLRGSTDFLPSFGVRSPVEYSDIEIIHAPRQSSPRGSGQLSPATSPRLLEKSLFPEPLVPKQSIEVPPSFTSNSQTESSEFPIFSGSSSRRESVDVPPLFISSLSKGVTEVLPSCDLRPSPKFKDNEIVCYNSPSSPKESAQPSSAASFGLSSKSLLFPPFLVPGVSKQSIEDLAASPTGSEREPIQGPVLSSPNSLKESTDVLSVPIFSLSGGAAQVLPSSAVKVSVQLEETESLCSFSSSFPRESAHSSPPISPRLSRKSSPLPPFSGTAAPKQSMEGSPSISSSRRESTQGPTVFVPNSLSKSFDFLIFSGPRTVRESLDIPPLSTSVSLKGSADILSSSSGPRAPIEYSERETSHSPKSSSPREPTQVSPTTSPNLVRRLPSLSPQVSLTSNLRLSKTLHSPSFSGPSVSKQSAEVPASISSSRRELIQGSAYSIPNSLKESFEFPIFAGLSSIRESVEVPPLSTSSSLRGPTDVIPSTVMRLPIEYSECECAFSASPSSPRESKQASPASSHTLLNKTFPFHSFSGSSMSKQPMKIPASSMPSSQKESIQVPDFSVPTSLRESFNFPIFSGPSSIIESLEVSPLSTSMSSKGLRSETEHKDNESVHPTSPSSPKESKKPSPPSSPNLISKYTQVFPFSESTVAKESIEFPDFSVSSSRRESIQGPAFFDSNSMTESFDFPIFSGAPSVRQSLEVPFFSPSSSLRGSTEVLPSSGLRSPIEYAEGERAHSPSSLRESRQPSHISSPNLENRSMHFSSSSSPSVSKQSMEVHVSLMLNSQRESIQDTASSAPNSLRKSFEFSIFSGPSSTRECLEVPSPYSRSNSTKESLPVIPVSGLTSVKEPEENKISAAVSQHSVSDFMEAQAFMGLSFRREFTQIQPPLIASHPQEIPEGPHLPSISSPRKFIQVPTSPSQRIQKEYMSLSPPSISQRESIQMSAASSSSSQKECIHFTDSPSPSSQTEFIDIPPSSIGSQRESIQIPVSYSKSSQKESKDHPFSTISSQRESIQVTDSPRPISQTASLDLPPSSSSSQGESIQDTDSPSPTSQRQSTGSTPSNNSSQKESIHFDDLSSPISQAKLIEVLPSCSPVSQKESLEVSTSLGLGPTEEFMQSPLSSARSSPKDFIDIIPLSGPDSSEELVGTPLSLGQSYLQNVIDREPMQVPFSPCPSSVDKSIQPSSASQKEKPIKPSKPSKEEREPMQIP